MPDPVEAIKASYAKDVTDEFVAPAVVEGTQPVGANDSIVFFNFRPDRARELTRTFVDPAFSGFEREMFPGILRLLYAVRRGNAECGGGV